MKTTDYRKYLEKKVQEETGGELGRFDWKDMLYIIPPVVLLAYIIVSAIF